MGEHMEWEYQNEKRWLNAKWRKRLGLDKSFNNNAMNLWVGNYLSGRDRACWSAEFFISYFYIAVTEASSSCDDKSEGDKTVKVNFY